MQIEKKDQNKWIVFIEEADNQLGLINTIRNLEKLDDEITNHNSEELSIDLNLSRLRSANSELISQFVIIHQSLVQKNGRLYLVEANPDLKSSFDVVMLDKIISVKYEGIDDKVESDEEE